MKHTRLATDLRLKDALIAKLRATRGSKDVLPELTLFVLRSLAAQFNGPELMETTKQACEAAGAAAEKSGKKNTREIRFIAAESLTDGVSDELWASLGVSKPMGEAELRNAGFLVNDDRLVPELRQDLEDAIVAFADARERLIFIASQGEEMYKMKVQEEEDVALIREELESALEGSTVQQRNALLEAARTACQAVFATKLDPFRSDREQFEAAFMRLTDEERLSVMRFRMLQDFLNPRPQGGHSHDGVPCHGHAHAAPEPQSHGHSHGGVPCGGATLHFCVY